MYTITIFDINFKTNKEKIETILRHIGLRKIQTNTYIGKLSNTDLTIFKKEIELAIREKDSLLILPICDKCYSKKEIFGREINFSENLCLNRILPHETYVGFYHLHLIFFLLIFSIATIILYFL